jgi:hypothetical protein
MSAVLVALASHIPERRMIALRLEKPSVSLSRLMREQAIWRDGQESRQAKVEDTGNQAD